MMKKVLSVVAIALLMGLSYLVGWRHSANNATTKTAGRRPVYWVDPMHPDFKSDHPGVAPDCGMELQPVYAEDIAGQFSSAAVTAAARGAVAVGPEMQQLVGIQTVVLEKSRAPREIRVLGRVVPEDTRVYRIDSGTDGYIRGTYDDSVGTLVKKDQKLATCFGPEYLSVASGFLAATAGVPGAVGKDGSRTMPFPGALSKQGVSSLQGYSDRLRNLGMSEVQIRQMAESRQLPEAIDIVSPTDGLVLSRTITPGQHFDRSTEFYRIADLSRVWIVAEIFGSDAQRLHPGAIAGVTLADQKKTFTARVTSVLPEVDPATRTLQLRLEADNPSLALRPDMFVDVDLPVSMPAGLTIPIDAVVDSGSEQRVFVERGDGRFEARQVQTGWRNGGRVEIVHGLLAGERIVTQGAFLLDSETRLQSIAESGEQARARASQGNVSHAAQQSKRKLSAQLENRLTLGGSGQRP
ncbi:MAG: efflux RND transporter periplasmic adaptor subunit [Acidobacteria bacterium]|nr:efflux RND transporter periplasmic adaptor subunit [Acidobacteriota bacterium]